MMRRPSLSLLVASLLFSSFAFADAFRMVNGRYADGPVTVLTLDDGQLVTVRTKRFVVLTAAQKRKLLESADVAPTALSVYSLQTAGKLCTCFDFNIAIWFADRQIEVPHKFLVSDDDAAKQTNEHEAMWTEELESGFEEPDS